MQLGSTATWRLISQDDKVKQRMPLFSKKSDSAKTLALTVFAEFPINADCKNDQ